MLGVPHVVAEGDGEVVQLDGGVEVVEVANRLETAGEEQGPQGGGGEVLGAGVGPDDGLRHQVIGAPFNEQAGHVVGLLPGEAPTEDRGPLCPFYAPALQARPAGQGGGGEVGARCRIQSVAEFTGAIARPVEPKEKPGLFPMVEWSR